MTHRIKVAAHVHSEWSYDASWTLPRLARAFDRRGYDAVLMCEHDDGFDAVRWQRYKAACAAASTASTLLVPGVEYGDVDNIVHIPVWGDTPFLGSGLPTVDLLTRARAEGAFTVFAHPWRRAAWRRLEPEWLPNLSSVEIWNRKYDGWAANAESVQLARQHGLRPFVSLDFHGRRQFFPLSMAVTVDGPVSRETIWRALHSGAFEPLVLSVTALRFTEGISGRALRALELARRRAARTLRSARARGAK
jgi:hypothetical protein